jgi:hypothetical protein
MLWQRLNIGSRVNREVHARFWERAEAKFLRATRPKSDISPALIRVCSTSESRHHSTQLACPLRARLGQTAPQQISALFDHLVGEREQERRNL